jgi:hypothetical protein
MQLCHTILEDLHHKVVVDLHLHIEEVLTENDGDCTHVVHHRQFSVLMSCNVCIVCNIFLQNAGGKQSLDGSTLCVPLSSIRISNTLSVGLCNIVIS